MNNKIQNEITSLMDKMQFANNINLIKELLNNFVSHSPKHNVEKIKIETIKNEFIREIESKKDKSKLVDKKSRLIKLILELEIKDLSLIQKLYHACGYPFPYESEHLSDLYDENLRLFVEEDVYAEYFEDGFETPEVEIFDDLDDEDTKYNQSNLEKFKRSFMRYVYVILQNKEEPANTYERITNELFKKIYFEDFDAFDNLFSESEYAEEFEWMYERHFSNLDEDKYKIIKLDVFRNVVLLGLIENICLPKGKKIKDIFRNTLDNNRNYVKDVLFDIVNYDDYYSYESFQKNYRNVFCIKDKEQKHNLFINYFTDVINNLKKEMRDFKELQCLTKQDIKLIVEDYKNTIDSK